VTINGDSAKKKGGKSGVTNVNLLNMSNSEDTSGDEE